MKSFFSYKIRIKEEVVAVNTHTKKGIENKFSVATNKNCYMTWMEYKIVRSYKNFIVVAL